MRLRGSASFASHFAVALLSLSACDSGTGPGGSSGGAFVRPTSFTVEVDYESGAAPYEGVGVGTPFADNVDALFPYLGSAYVGPATVGEMEDVGAIADDSLTSDEILALAAIHRSSGRTDGPTRRLYVLYVDGHYEDDDGPNTNVLGVSIGSTGVIAMFKPVIESASGVQSVRRKVEQAVFIHEFGHSVGLVDNGIASVAAHSDTAHAGHCTNQDCVMYWENHTGGNLLDFITTHMNGAETVLFDDDCISDVHTHFGR